jgi:hypothetical protein
MFKNGCPMCGYSAYPVQKPAKTNKARPEKKHVHSAPAPLTYIIAVVVLIAFIAILSWFITR